MPFLYTVELERLSEVYHAAMTVDIASFVSVIESTVARPMATIGSGGSFSSASYAAELHRRFTGQLATPLTPLQVIESPRLNAALLCFSASGRNRDICMAFKTATLREGGPVSAMTMSTGTPLEAIANKYPIATVVSIKHPSFKDGFLAVATLLASAILLERAYAKATGVEQALPETLAALEAHSLSGQTFSDVEENAADAVSRPTVSILYSSGLKPVADDMESRFVEAALGDLHTSDFRNFGHGRHHWLAKRGETTGVIALVSKNAKRLADRTLGLLPKTASQTRIDFNGDDPSQRVAALVVGFHISMAAGRAAGIDPGKPGVPLFGRKLYGLGPGSSREGARTINRLAAVWRKMDAAQVRKNEALWIARHEEVMKKVTTTPVGGLVLDYDGTLCGEESRFGSLPGDMAEHLGRLASDGVEIGIATGRGPSAGVAIRASLSRQFWDQMVIGYYNGTVIVPLSVDDDPIAEEQEDDELLNRLSDEPVFDGSEVRSLTVQTTILLSRPALRNQAVAKARRILYELGRNGDVVASSHSIDIVHGHGSKTEVARTVQRRCAGAHVFRIGDRGAWPGNDSALLDHPLGLSVDEVSDHAHHCWNLAPAGVCGIHATRFYLDCLRNANGVSRLDLKLADRGGAR